MTAGTEEGRLNPSLTRVHFPFFLLLWEVRVCWQKRGIAEGQEPAVG